MNYNNEELKKLQVLEKNMLKDIIEFCKKNKIEYFIIGGTALGAVRHKGFIPWDDDIDIGMPRKDYNKFLLLAYKEWNRKDSPYFFQYNESDVNTPYTYAKLRLNDTIFSEYCNRNINMHQGIYIDIFPYDNMPDNKEEYKNWFFQIQRLTKLYVMSKTPDISEKPITFNLKIKYIIRRIIYFLLKLLPKKLILKQIIKLSTKYNSMNTKSMTCTCFPKMYCEYCDIQDLYPLKEYKFEELSVLGPNNMDKYLKNHYGNYMKLPPEKDRIGHKPYNFKLKDN